MAELEKRAFQGVNDLLNCESPFKLADLSSLLTRL